MTAIILPEDVRTTFTAAEATSGLPKFGRVADLQQVIADKHVQVDAITNLADAKVVLNQMVNLLGQIVITLAALRARFG